MISFLSDELDKIEKEIKETDEKGLAYLQGQYDAYFTVMDILNKERCSRCDLG